MQKVTRFMVNSQFITNEYEEIVFKSFEDPLKAPPTYSYLVQRVSSIFLVIRHLVLSTFLIACVAP